MPVNIPVTVSPVIIAKTSFTCAFSEQTQHQSIYKSNISKNKSEHPWWITILDHNI